MKTEFYGIDLGTTYSCIATIDSDDIVQVIPNKAGQVITPSAVYFDEKDNMLVGQAAKAHLADKPENTVVFIKREMSNPDYTVTINGKNYDPVQISSFILKALVDAANERRKNEEGKDPLYDVVITVPAYFANMERERTIAAGKMAGLNVIQVINEPTAAAVSYGRKQQADKTLLVYDLGGGTFDVSILKFHGGIVDTLSTRGDHHLGGADWDAALARIATKKIGADFDDMPKAEQNKLMLVAEDCKKMLTETESATMQFNYKGIKNVEVTRAEFEDATLDLMIKTKLLLEEALDAANLTAGAIDEIILVGGSSRMPMVDKLVSELFSIKAKIADPDMAVAKGAALTASQATKDWVKGGIVMGKDKGSRAYGFKATRGEDNAELVYNLILRNDDMEIRRELNEFVTLADGQESVVFEFYENESNEQWKDIVPEEQLQGRDDKICWGHPVPKGTPIKIVVERDKSGCVRVFAECCGARGEFEIVAPGCNGLTRR